MSNFDEKDLLTQELRERSAGVGGHPIGLDAVRSRARSIRRRRNAVRGTVAAVVLAVAAPVGLSATDLLGSSGPAPAPPAASPDAGPTPQADGTFLLTLVDVPRGEDPDLAYLVDAGRRLVTPDGTRELPRPFTMITPYDAGWLGLAETPGDQGGLDVVMLDEDLAVVKSDPSASMRLAVSDDGTRVAYTERTSAETLLVSAPTDGGDPVTWPLPYSRNTLVDPVAFGGDDTVVYRTDGEEMEIGMATVGGEVSDVTGFQTVADASVAGLLAGQVSYDDFDGACSGMRDLSAGDETMLWERCELSLSQFSPDGRYVIGGPGMYDAYGPAGLSVLDARTGDPVVEFSAERGGRTVLGVSQAAWEDEDTVLAAVVEGDRMAMLRLELDGSVEVVTETFPVGDMSLAFWFADAPR